MKGKSIPALRVHQWLPEWEEIHWQPKEKRTEPQHWFYQFSMAAADLKALSGVYPRTTKRKKASEDLGIQRGHDASRSNEISKFVRYGYPWSDLSEAKRKSGNFQDLRQPGWLPTAIVVNILTQNTVRQGKRVAPSDLVKIVDSDHGAAKLLLPKLIKNWQPKHIHPIEIIDGQHRLWAFKDVPEGGDYELPVIAFIDLDLSWQAYLFYTINIKPKKINASLAYDLYPLLRTEKWLMKFEGHSIYRETRAQELVDLLWSHQQSPWHQRINMLGETGVRKQGLMVTQASWIRSLLASFVKSWKEGGKSIGGLFGSAVGEDQTVLRWTRLEQAAFLIVIGQSLQKVISGMDEPWMETLRKQKIQNSMFGDEAQDVAFFGPNNLLNSDQGIRTFLQITNDLCFVQADRLRLHEWENQYDNEVTDMEKINVAISSLRKEKRIYTFLRQLAICLASYDWRTSTGPDLTEEERILKASFRGSGGYKELRQDVLRHIVSRGKKPINQAAAEVQKRLKR